MDYIIFIVINKFLIKIIIKINYGANNMAGFLGAFIGTAIGAAGPKVGQQAKVKDLDLKLCVGVGLTAMPLALALSAPVDLVIFAYASMPIAFETIGKMMAGEKPEFSLGAILSFGCSIVAIACIVAMSATGVLGATTVAGTILSFCAGAAGSGAAMFGLKKLISTYN